MARVLNCRVELGENKVLSLNSTEIQFNLITTNNLNFVLNFTSEMKKKTKQNTFNVFFVSYNHDSNCWLLSYFIYLKKKSLISYIDRPINNIYSRYSFPSLK